MASPLVSLKYSKVLKSKVYPNLVKGLIDIKLSKNFSFIYLG